MFWENTFEVPREMPESIISGACEHNPRTPNRENKELKQQQPPKEVNTARLREYLQECDTQPTLQYQQHAGEVSQGVYGEGLPMDAPELLINQPRLQ